jgi:hypothetical protein
MNLRASCGQSLTLWQNTGKGVLFRLEPEEPPQKPDIWADYDPVKVRQGLKRSAGALKGVDHEALKKDIHRLRQEDNPDRP